MQSVDRLARRVPWWGWTALLLLVPLLITMAWGEGANGVGVSDAAFELLLAARDAAPSVSREVAPVSGGALVTGAPLYVLFLTAAGSWAPQAALLAGALGWSATAGVVYVALRAAGRPSAALLAALLLIVSPMIVRTAGTALPWTAALGWEAAALALLPHRPLKLFWPLTLLLLALLGLHFGAVTILFALTLAAIARHKEMTGWLLLTLLAIVAMLWGLWAIPRFGAPPAADPIFWWQQATAYVAARPLSWLYLPFVLLGIWDTWWPDRSPNIPVRHGRSFFGLLIMWVLAAIVVGDTVAPVLLGVLVLGLAALGAARLARYLLAYSALTFDASRPAWLVSAVIAAPLLLVSWSQLWGHFAGRSPSQVRLEEKTAAWLAQNTEDGATLYAPPRVGYLAGRPTLPARVEQIRDDNVAVVYDGLLAQTPDYIVSANSFAWDYVTRTTWFGDHYRVQQRFGDGYAPDAPLTVWAREVIPADSDDPQRLRAVVDDRFALVGYDYEPQVITPGDDVYLTLYLEALQPVEHGFVTGVHLSAPDGWVWAWREERTPRSFSGQWWETGQVIPERFRLLTTEDIPTGAYDLQVFWRAGDEKDNLPVRLEGTEQAVERVFLGFVVAPPPADMAQAAPVGAAFGDTISLKAFQAGELIPGEPWEVTLFWEALDNPPRDYSVFVHVLNEAGELVSAHDGMPLNNRYPTSAWRTGSVIPDTHSLALPADLAPGTYSLNTGLYLLETGERLPVWDGAGIEQSDRSLPLVTVEYAP
jgi:hypothetical protein